MIIEAYDQDYQIKEYTLRRFGNELTLKWQYAKGTHFLLLLYDARELVDLEKIALEIEGKGYTDKALVQKTGNQLSLTENEKIKIFLYREQEFMQNGQSCVLQGNVIKSGIPYAVSVLAGEYDKSDEILRIYQGQNADSNTQYIPVRVEAQIRYKSRWWSKEKVCILHLPFLEDYAEGALQYHVDGVRTQFPIPSACLDKDLYVFIPKNSAVTVRAAEKYKKYYKM